MEKVIKRENLSVLKNCYWTLVDGGDYEKAMDFKCEVNFKSNDSKNYKFCGYCFVSDHADMILRKYNDKYYLYDTDKYGTERYTLTEKMIEVLKIFEAL